MAPSRPPNKDEKPPGAASLLSSAETQLEVGNLEEAISLAHQALEATGSGGDFELRALNLLGTLYVEVGDVDEARACLESAVNLDQDGTMDERIGGGPEKFMLLAQLSEEGGQDSVRWYERGASALRKQIGAMTDGGSQTAGPGSELAARQLKLGGVLCAVVEVYMTDLSWEEDAESRCESLITEATMVAPTLPETWQTVANVRISQQRVDEARDALRRSMEIWQDLAPDDPVVPQFAARISLSRLLLEVEMEREAIEVLHRLVSEDDQSVEAWYLGGWGQYIVGEKGRDAAAAAGGDEGWKSAWSSARQWLTICLKLYEAQEYEDERLGEHAKELLLSINKELGEPVEGEEEEEWDGLSDGEDEDEEMQD